MKTKFMNLERNLRANIPQKLLVKAGITFACTNGLVYRAELRQTDAEKKHMFIR